VVGFVMLPLGALAAFSNCNHGNSNGSALCNNGEHKPFCKWNCACSSRRKQVSTIADVNKSVENVQLCSLANWTAFGFASFGSYLVIGFETLSLQFGIEREWRETHEYL